MRGNKHLLKLIRITIKELLIQAEAQIMFWLGDKAVDIYEKRKGSNHISTKKAFLLVQIT